MSRGLERRINEEGNDYGLGYGESITSIFSDRRAAKQCAYLLPYIKPGQNILDVGCGPGSITADFAEIVSDSGLVVGVDIDGSQLEYARSLSQARELSNVKFMPGNILNLPFDDDTFDICHVSAVLCQISNPASGLKELKRVTKPGGIVAAREPIFECYVIYPDVPLFKESIHLATHAVNALDSDFNLGKKLTAIYNEVGFSKIDISATCESQTTSFEVKRVCDSLLEDWQHAPWSQYIREQKLAGEQKIAEYINAIQYFSSLPATLLAIPWGQAIGWV